MKSKSGYNKLLEIARDHLGEIVSTTNGDFMVSEISRNNDFRVCVTLNSMQENQLAQVSLNQFYTMIQG